MFDIKDFFKNLKDGKYITFAIITFILFIKAHSIYKKAKSFFSDNTSKDIHDESKNSDNKNITSSTSHTKNTNESFINMDIFFSSKDNNTSVNKEGDRFDEYDESYDDEKTDGGSDRESDEESVYHTPPSTPSKSVDYENSDRESYSAPSTSEITPRAKQPSLPQLIFALIRF